MRDRVEGGLAGQLTGIDLPVPDDLPGDIAGSIEALVLRRPAGRYVEVGHDGGRREACFGDLLERARDVLGHCQRAGVGPGSEIILGFDRFIEFIPALWASFLGGFWAIPWHITASETAGVGLEDRLSVMADTFKAPFLLCSEKHAGKLRAAAGDIAPSISVLALPDAIPRDARRPAAAAGSPEGGGLLVATSGTTGTPKFARIPASVMLNRFFANHTRYRAVSRLVPFPFDGVTGLWLALPADDTEVYLNPQRMMARPAEYLDIVSEYGVGSMSLSSSMLEKVVEVIEAGDRRFDLSCVTRIGLGAEMVVPQIVSRLLACLARAGADHAAINFGYGSSEMGTICATRYSRAEEALAAIGDGSAPVSVGGVLESISLRIVDDENQPLPLGETGNIQVRSDKKMFSGYAGPGGDDVSCFVDGWLKTGDMGFIENGELHVSGRQESKIIVNGKNISLERIEAALRRLKGLPVSAVVAAAIRMPGGATEELGLFFVPATAENADLDTLVRRLRRETAKAAGITAKHVVPVKQDDIVRTPTQKIKRQLLVDNFLAGKLAPHVQAPRRRRTVAPGRAEGVPMPADTEAWLGELWRRVLKLNAAPGPDEDFFELGGDSLATAEMIFAVEGKFGISLPLEAYYSDPTLRGLGALLSTATPDAAMATDARTARMSGTAVLRELELFQGSWSGVRKFPGSLIAGHNVTGTRMPLFWVFQDDDEASRLARRLDPNQPLYAMRSLVGIVPVRDYTSDMLDRVCDRYLWEILAIVGNRPIAIGGNCQAAIIAMALARRLRQLGRAPAVLVLMEWAYNLGAYQDFTGILYSRDGHVADIYLKPGETVPDWRRDFPDRKVYETAGEYGEIFYDENIDSVVGPLTELLREAATRMSFGRVRPLLWEIEARLRRTSGRVAKEYDRFKRRRLSMPGRAGRRRGPD